MRVGFIGLGNMGEPMARNLAKAGHALTVYNRTRSRAAALEAAGARVADRPADAAQAEAVVTMLADDDAVASVAFGEAGIIAHLAPGAVHVSMSTISVALSERLAKAHADAGQRYVAAPVFGRPQAAEEAKLFVVAAGAPDGVADCRPLFAAVGQRTFEFGADAPIANLVKLSGNFLIAAVIEGLGEAFALVRKHGVDPHHYLDMLTATLFAAPVYRTYGGLIADARYDPPGFKLPLGLKDVRLLLAAGEAAGVPMPIASLIRDHALSGVARGYGELDWSVLGRVAAENAGLPT